MSTPIVHIDSVTKIFPGIDTPAINNITLTLSKGGIIGLVGPDGSGKTTLLRLLTSLLLPTSGAIKINGYDTKTDQKIISHIIGYMPQKFGLYEDLSVIQNLNLYAALQDVSPENQKKLFNTLLTFTNLHPFTERKAGNLSGGMKQKLGLACALLRKPPLLLLDEPSAGVDPVSRRELWNMVLQIVEEGTTVIWSTSYLDEASKCSSVILLDKGSVLFQGDPSTLTQKTEGRVFLLKNATICKRTLLSDALQKDSVIDGVIQGDFVRIVVKKPDTVPISFPDDDITKTPARFEDAFIELLGGAPKEKSPLSKILKPIENGSTIIVDAKHLTKKFGTFTAVNDISFTVKKGEIFGLLGPNGAGKSTTFKMLCGLLRPTSGDPLVNGIHLQEAPSEGRAQLGYMSQKFSLYSMLTLEQNLLFFSGLYKISGPQQKKIIEVITEAFTFQSYLKEQTGDLPLGYKQRLALACSIMHCPKVLFLDEPTSGVDPITRREFWGHIHCIVEKGITVMVSTHFMDEAEHCDRIGLVYKSHMIQMSTPDDLKKSCATKDCPFPTLEEAFIRHIERYEKEKGKNT